ncbi:MAG: hypothetical protein LUC24_02610 [Bacteroidales bacterium]|nr:hypothetical protein [Bacteroidales bacterium]
MQTMDTFNTNLPVNILAILSVVLIICIIPRFINVIPSALRAIFKWKESVSIEYNVKLCRDRNIVYASLLIPACLMLDRYLPSFPRFMTSLHPALHLLVTFAILLVYTRLRAIMARLCKKPKTDSLGYTAAIRLWRSVICIAVPICLATAAVMGFAHSSAEIVKTVVFYEIILFYILLTVREWEILKHYCSVLTTFLYLCALEILPAAFIVILWTV